MKKYSQTLSDQEDKNLQSRLSLKKKLEQFPIINQSLDISSFGDSRNNQLSKYTNVFPKISDPTLEIKEIEQNYPFTSNISIKNQLDRYHRQDSTARNNYKGEVQLQQNIHSLTKDLVQTEKKLELAKRKNDHLQQLLEKANKQLKIKDQIIKQQALEIKDIKTKQSIRLYDSKQSISSTSRFSMDDSLHNFCPQLLSPEETVLLLNQLLKKVSKSSKMIKSLTSDMSLKDILQKLQKH